MSNKATPGLILIGLALATSAVGQAPDWRRVGNAAIDLELAGLATGPVDRVWFSPAGDRLLIRVTRASAIKTFETNDFDQWSAASANTIAPAIPEGRSINLPENGAQVRNPAGLTPRVYAFGRFVYRSDNSGKNWDNLTAFHGLSIIGDGLRDLAVSPANEDEIVVAGSAGIFRSMDGGKSWSSLNESLPNLPWARIRNLPEGTQGAQLELPGTMVIEWQPGERQAWRPAYNGDAASELIYRQILSDNRGAAVTALALREPYVYTGMADGRIIVSADRAITWQPDTRIGQSGAVTAFWVDPSDPRIALAVLASLPHGAEGIPARVLHTIDGGLSWDDISANLPDVTVRGITADPAGSAIYIATDQGVFFARTNLNVLSVTAASWTAVTGLPPVAATDVKLDSGAIQLWVALEGYGMYQAMAPHRAGDPRLISSAGLIARAAAPGTLFSIEGARVNSANAGGLAVPILAATDNSSQIQIPFEVRGDSLALAIDGPGGARVLSSVPLVSTAPAIQLDPRDGAPLLLDADNGVLLDAMHPAHSRTRVQILATGLGRVQPAWPTGLPAPADSPHTVAAPVRALIDRSPAQVTRAILAPGYVGMYLVEIEIPNIVNYGPAELYIEVDGQPSNRVRVYIEP
ncbi:MAG: hypothetical protein JWO19_2586 [Bryobacterales bacterium]|jgi:uncharacterized protein (TIGR03437 family)|nr:hypothetical protein [Bryobacterales bacterium]